MSPEKWQTILGQIKDNFEVVEEGAYKEDEEGGKEIEFIVFFSPIGKVKLEFITKPAVIDRKVIYSNRIGSQTQVEYIYSPDEKVFKLAAYQWDDDLDEWQEIKSSDLGF